GRVGSRCGRRLRGHDLGAPGAWHRRSASSGADLSLGSPDHANSWVSRRSRIGDNSLGRGDGQAHPGDLGLSARPTDFMKVRCPHCSTDYLLPEHLLGEGGARVRCPGCAGSFLVSTSGEVAAESPPRDQAEPESSASPEPTTNPATEGEQDVAADPETG